MITMDTHSKRSIEGPELKSVGKVLHSDGPQLGAKGLAEPEPDFSRVDRIWHLRQSGLADGLTDSELKAVASICRDGIYEAGEPIFERGDAVDHLYILFRGSVRNSVGDANGQERIVSFAKPGDLLGDSVLGPSPVQLSEAVAHEECWVGRIARRDFIGLLRERPSLSFNFMRILSQELGAARDEIKSLSFMDTQGRLAKTLLHLGRNHGKSVIARQSYRKLKFHLSHEHLARLIGANRPHVSTIMSSFRKKGWINYQNRRMLIDMQRMRVLSGTSDRGKLAG